MRGILLDLLDMGAYGLQFVIYVCMRIVKSVAWWIPIPKFGFWRQSEERISKDLTLIILVGVPITIYILFGWFWVLMALIAYLITLGVYFLIILKQSKQHEQSNDKTR